jgi:ATP/maltotriose-dependent transcriptional regulator MalT
MAVAPTDLNRARDAARREAWPEVYEILSDCDRDALGGEDLEMLSDAAWWLCLGDDYLDARRRAYSAYLREGNLQRAVFSAWHLFYEHLFRGEASVASGWLKRAQRHLLDQPESVMHGYVAFADADLAHGAGELDDALSHVRRATEIGRRFDDPNLVAMGIQMEGAVLMTQGKVEEGAALLDEAMASVIGEEVSSFFAGWIYCYVLAACHRAGDLRRAGEWTDAAMRWCESLSASSIYHGICRVHHVEIMGLRGAIAEAERQALVACDELAKWYPSIAAEALYLCGELRRRIGDFAGAEESFSRAHGEGRDPHPGLALLRLAQGRPEAGVMGLRDAVAQDSPDRLSRSRLLEAQCEIAIATGDLDSARIAADELDAIATDFGTSPALRALADGTRGAQLLAEGEAEAAGACARRAWTIWQELGVPYEAARARLLLGMSARHSGDEDTARLEIEAAKAAFAKLGTLPDAERAEALLSESDSSHGLTQRELEVLRLVVAGKSNKELAAELVISEHTVARHLSNIFGKLGVSSRAQATAFALEHEIL